MRAVIGVLLNLTHDNGTLIYNQTFFPFSFTFYSLSLLSSLFIYIYLEESNNSVLWLIVCLM